MAIKSLKTLIASICVGRMRCVYEDSSQRSCSLPRMPTRTPMPVIHFDTNIAKGAITDRK